MIGEFGIRGIEGCRGKKIQLSVGKREVDINGPGKTVLEWRIRKRAREREREKSFPYDHDEEGGQFIQ